tara:strand:- start:15023 stop:16780 length:1758 start_codon:yes stop_codon:yes gene_type:complete
MIKFITNGGSLEVKNVGEAVLLFIPMKNIAFTSLELYEDIPTISLYNINVGLNERLFSAPLSQVADNDGNFFTVDSFLTYASLNFGMTPTESSTPSSGTSDSLIHKFPIKNGQTIVENTFVQLDNNGEIFNIESSGSIPLQFPVGSSYEYSTTFAPENTSSDNLVKFVDDRENFIMFFSNRNSNNLYDGMFVGGSVDALGNYDIKNEPVDANDGKFINFDIDQTTFGQSTVKGLCTFSTQNSQNLWGNTFEYVVATQVFTFGQVQQIAPNMGGNQYGKALVNIGSNKYLSEGGQYNMDEEVFVLTVSGNVITKQTPTILPNNNGAGTFIKISNDKVISIRKSQNYKIEAQVLNISGNDITLGTLSESTWNEYGNMYATQVLNSNNQFYLYNQSGSGGAGSIRQQTYDSATDTITFDDANMQLTEGIQPSDMFFNLASEQVIISGAGQNTGVPMVVVMQFGKNIINSTLGIASNYYVGSGMNSFGEFVFNWNQDSNSANKKATTSYGRVGDIISNLDYMGLIGVATDGIGNVKISGSVVTDSNLTLAINQDVYVSGQGTISTTFSNTSSVIGYSISATSYILNINK